MSLMTNGRQGLQFHLELVAQSGDETEVEMFSFMVKRNNIKKLNACIHNKMHF